MATQSYSVSSKPTICVEPAFVGILDYMKTTGHKSNMSDVPEDRAVWPYTWILIKVREEFRL